MSKLAKPDFTIEKVLEETADYRLVVGIADVVEEMAGRRVYIVVNKHFNIIEALGPVYPMAIKTLYDLQADLDLVRNETSQYQFGGEDDSPLFH